MAAPSTTTGTAVPPQQGGAFPPFETQTYPAQLFWLTITFVVLLLVMWRVGVKRIGGAIGERRERINGDLSAAEASRKNAEDASAAYETALADARARAQTLMEENRNRIRTELDAAMAKANAEAEDAQADAERRIASLRADAKAHVAEAAGDAAVTIVAKLTGDTVSSDEVAAAVKAVGRG